MVDTNRLRDLIWKINPPQHQHIGSCQICSDKFAAEREILAQVESLLDELEQFKKAMREIAATDDGIGGIIAEDILGIKREWKGQ